MVFCQVLVTPTASGGSTANGAYQVIPVTGKCSIRVLGVQYHDTAASTTYRTVQLQSDNLIFSYSPMRYLTWITNAVSTVSVDVSKLDYHLNDQVLNGQIYFRVVDLATGAEPAGFSQCLVTLDIEMINRQYRTDS